MPEPWGSGNQDVTRIIPVRTRVQRKDLAAIVGAPVTTKLRESRPLDRLESVRAPIGFAIAVIGAAVTAAPQSNSFRELAASFTLTWVGLLFTAWHRDYGVFSASSVYLIVFGLFHGGLLVAIALVGEGAYVAHDNSWITPENLKAPAAIVSVAMVAFGVGAHFAPKIPLDRAAVSGIDAVSRLAIAGKLILTVGLLLSGVAVLAGGGPSVLASNYDAFTAASSGRQFAVGLGFVMTGCGLLICAGDEDRLWGWGVFAVLAIVGLPLGLRGPFMFPAAAFIVIEARRRRIPSLTLVPAAIALLTLTSVLRQTRAGGLRALLDLHGVAFAPMQGLAEMGSSIRTVMFVRDWMATGLPPQHGITLVAPIVRMFERLTGTSTTDLDYRLFNVEMLNRAGPFGGSPVAEGLRNGGVPFAICLMLVLGLIVGALNKLPNGPLASAAVILFLTPLLVNTRNGFASVPAQWIIGSVVFYLVLYWPRKRVRSTHGG